MAARRNQVSKTVTTRTTQTSRRVAAAPDVEVVDEDAEEAKPRSGLPDALVFATTLMLLLAIVITDYWLGKQLGSGVFFKS